MQPESPDVSGDATAPGAMSTLEQIAAQVIVPRALAGVRLDRAAAELFDGFSRVALARWIEDGQLTCNGARARPSDRMRGASGCPAPSAIVSQRTRSDGSPMRSA